MSQSAVADLSSPYDLSSESIESFRKNGHVLLRKLCPSPAIEGYRDAIIAAAMAHNRETRPLEDRDTYGKAFLQIMNLWRVDETVRNFVFAKRFAKVAADLLGVPSVRLYHDQALFKEPGGGHTPWHQDQFYWPLQTNNTVTLWMPLVDVSEVMGSMTFASGSHLAGEATSTAISDQSEAFFDDFVKQKGFPLETAGAMNAGDATFHTGWALHRAPGNVTDRVRAVMTIIYFADGTPIAEPRNDFQKNDLATWLDSGTPGTPAAGPLNPVLWP
jgi:hypothetical protein